MTVIASSPGTPRTPRSVALTPVASRGYPGGTITINDVTPWPGRSTGEERLEQGQPGVDRPHVRQQPHRQRSHRQQLVRLSLLDRHVVRLNEHGRARGGQDRFHSVKTLVPVPPAISRRSPQCISGGCGVVAVPGPTLGRDADRDMERQLAEGPAGPGGGVAGLRPARRPVHAGDQAGRQRLPRPGLRRPRLRRRPLRPGPVERGGDPQPGGASTRWWPASPTRPRTRPPRPACCGPRAAGCGWQRVRPQRAHGRQRVLRGQAGVAGTPAPAPRHRVRPRRAAGGLRRLQRRARRP